MTDGTDGVCQRLLHLLQAFQHDFDFVAPFYRDRRGDITGTNTVKMPAHHGQRRKQNAAGNDQCQRGEGNQQYQHHRGVDHNVLV
ncbi:hypothetical protein D3C80_1815700 [compost metagenome]